MQRLCIELNSECMQFCANLAHLTINHDNQSELLLMESGLIIRLTQAPQQTKGLLLFEQEICIFSQLQLLTKLHRTWLTAEWLIYKWSSFVPWLLGSDNAMLLSISGLKTASIPCKGVRHNFQHAILLYSRNNLHAEAAVASNLTSPCSRPELPRLVHGYQTLAS